MLKAVSSQEKMEDALAYKYMSSKEAAEFMGYTIQHTRFLIREGTLPGIKFGRDWLIDRQAVTIYLGGYPSPYSDPEPADNLPQIANLKAVNVAQVPQRSPFRYPGGKTWLIPCIRHWLGSQHAPVEKMIEPFAGGGIVGLTALFEGLAHQLTLVELDEDVAAVWRTILNGHGEWLAEEILAFQVSEQSIQSLFAEEHLSLERRAFATLVRNRVARGGILAPGAGVVKNGENGKGLTSRWYPATLHQRILEIVARKAHIAFIEGDGMETLRTLGTRADCCWFIDPPYTVAGKRLYRHSEIDHEELFFQASRLAGDFLITYDNAPEIKYLADKYHLATRLIAMKTTHHSIKYELVIGKSLHWLSTELSGDLFADL